MVNFELSKPVRFEAQNGALTLSIPPKSIMVLELSN